MKKVFNNQQLCHVWASQSQNNGRNSNGSMFFEGNTIYSYGRHYAMATIHENGQGKLVLVNEHRYSMTTGRQRSDVIDAIRGTNYIMVPDVTSLNSESNEIYLYNCLVNSIDEALNTRKLWGSMDYVDDALKDLNLYLSFNNKPTVTLEPLYYASMTECKYVKEAKKAEKERTKTFKQRIAAEKYEVEQKQIKIDHANLVQQWLNGAQINERIRWDLFKNEYPTNVIRIKPSDSTVVETNSGAEVPLRHALLLLKSTINKEVKQGDRVGHFKVDEIKQDTLEIGCHTISIEQAKSVLIKYLVSGSVNERQGS